MSSNTGFTNGVLNGRFHRIGSERLGIKYDSGTFSVINANGLDLSDVNAAYVTLPSKANPGRLTTYDIIANQSFIDDAGSSEIIGNLFGFITGVAIAVDVPFFLYAVTNDDEDAIAFMISRHPHRITSPAAANIGAPDDVVANLEGDFWSLDNIDETLYDQNPCLCVGSFRMQMSASDDWTVQALSSSDGIDMFQDQTAFSVPTGQFGANAGTLTIDNGGTSAVFTTTVSRYHISRNGYVSYNFFFDVATGANGAGAVVAQITAPFNASSTTVNIHGVGTARWAGLNTFDISYRLAPNNVISLTQDNTTATSLVLWSAFAAGARNITGTMYYKLGTT